MTAKLNELRKNNVPFIYNPVGLEIKIDKRKKLINVLLDYYFDPEEDEEFIQENRPE